MTDDHLGDVRGRLEQGRFVRLWTGASRHVHALIATLVFNRADAEDLLQEVGVTAWEKFSEFDDSKNFVAWACGIARNKVLSFNQKSSRRLVLTSDLMDLIEMEVRKESQILVRQQEALEVCLKRLDNEERKLLSLRYAGEISLKEAAVKSGRSLQAIYKSLQRIHDRLLICVQARLAALGNQ